MNLRVWLRRQLYRLDLWLRKVKPPKPADARGVIRALGDSLNDALLMRDHDRADYIER